MRPVRCAIHNREMEYDGNSDVWFCPECDIDENFRGEERFLKRQKYRDAEIEEVLKDGGFE